MSVIFIVSIFYSYLIPYVIPILLCRRDLFSCILRSTRVVSSVCSLLYSLRTVLLLFVSIVLQFISWYFPFLPHNLILSSILIILNRWLGSIFSIKKCLRLIASHNTNIFVIITTTNYCQSRCINVGKSCDSATKLRDTIIWKGSPIIFIITVFVIVFKVRISSKTKIIKKKALLK